MRLALRIVAVGIALVLVGLVALVLLLPRIVQSEAVRTRIEAAAGEATGGELAYTGLDLGLLPPRLVVEAPSIRAAGAEAPALSAEAVDLRVALLPLLAGAVVVDSLRVTGARATLERSEAGVGVPGLFPADGAAKKAPAEPPAEAVPGAEPDGAAAEGEALRLAVRRVDLEDARIELVDRSVEPAVRWTFEEVEGRLRGESLDAPVQVELGAKLASGGALRGEGTVALDGAADLVVALVDVALAPLAPYAELPAGTPFEGRVDGELGLRQEAGGDPALRADLRLREAKLAMEGSSLTGALTAKAELAGPPDALTGRIDVDATPAALAVEDLLDKPAGTRLRLAGPLRMEGQEIRLEDAELAFDELRGRLDAAFGKRTRVRLDAPSFDVSGFERFVIPLRDTPPRGALRFEGFEAKLEPLALAGRIGLEDLEIQPEGDPPLRLRGALVGRGDELSGEELVVTLAGQTIPVGLRLRQLAAAVPRLDLTAEGEDLETGALMAAFGQAEDLLRGPLDFDASLGGPLASDGSILEQLTGRFAFEITPGTLRGVSILQDAFGRLGSAGQLALLAGSGQEKLQRFYGDQFQRLGGTVQVARGLARTDDLQLDYGSYLVDLRGAIGLEDLALDMTGKITIREEVDRTLSGAAQGGRTRVIPLAHVGGTLAEPRVQITQQALLSFAAAYTQDSRRREKWEEEIDERLGEGTGKELMRSLDRLLGGGAGESR